MHWRRFSFTPACVIAAVLALAGGATHAQQRTHEVRHTNPPNMGAATQATASQSEGAQAQSKAAQSDRTRGRTEVSAKDITHAVEDELHHDALVSLDDVQVTTDKGVVTLTGVVASLLAKERAAHVAETVKGVYSVNNRIVVKPTRSMDADDLESTIVQALLVDPATEAFNVTVEADPAGRVALTGQSQSWAEKKLIGRVAKGVSGVTEVANHVSVNYEVQRPDAQLVPEIEGLLRWDAYLGPGLIDVSARHGVVTLSGTVGSAAEKRRATAIAWTAGVKEVNADALKVADPLKVAQWRGEDANPDTILHSAVVSDEDIANAVRKRLSTEARVADSNLDVSVDEGVVTLRGTVDSLKAKRAAKQQAQAVRRVDSVRDRMRVASDAASMSDQEIKRRVINALAINPVTEAEEVSVDVNRGVVQPTGHVDSWFERGAADDAAARVRGVREVDNDLSVSDANDQLTYDPYVDVWSIYEYDWYDPEAPTIWRQDSAIAKEVRNELWWSTFVNESEIEISVQCGDTDRTRGQSRRASGRGRKRV